MINNRDVAKRMLEQLTERKEQDHPANDPSPLTDEENRPSHLMHFFRIAAYRKRQILERMLMD